MIKHITKKLYAIVTNHNNLPGDDQKGSIVRHGAISLYHEDLSYGSGEFFSLEWCLGQFNLGSTITLHSPGCENDIEGAAQVPGVSLYWSISNVPYRELWHLWLGLYKLPDDRHTHGQFISRETGVRVFDWKLWVDIWRREHSYSRQDPWWMHNTVDLNPLNLLFGTTRYDDGPTIHDEVVDFPMPEKSYRGRVRIQANQWKRPRWPWPKTVLRAHVDMEEPIPFPGKGENSWDCGDDAIYGSTFPCRSVEEAVGRVVGTALRNRQRYGGRHTFEPSGAN